MSKEKYLFRMPLLQRKRNTPVGIATPVKYAVKADVASVGLNQRIKHRPNIGEYVLTGGQNLKKRNSWEGM
jgi:hypothetical protein